MHTATQDGFDLFSGVPMVPMIGAIIDLVCYLGPAWYNIATLQGDGNYLPTPIFYGMLLFSKIEGQQIAATTIVGPANVTAIATKGANGNANIIVVNNDPVKPAIITPKQSVAWTSAHVLLVQDGAGGGCSDSTAKIGGAALGESGSWTGAPFSIANGATVSIPPCGHAEVQILP